MRRDEQDVGDNRYSECHADAGCFEERLPLGRECDAELFDRDDADATEREYAEIANRAAERLAKDRYAEERGDNDQDRRHEDGHDRSGAESNRRLACRLFAGGADEVGSLRHR